VSQPSASQADDSAIRTCWCSEGRLAAYSRDYLVCTACHTLVSTWTHAKDVSRVVDDERDFYGREYWYSGQARTPGLTSIEDRARTDLVDRTPHWLRTFLKYKLPPARVLELGSSHGGFVALLRWAGFEARGLELSRSIVDLARDMFDAPTLIGPLEDQSLEGGSLDGVVLMDVLEHLPDPAGTLQEAARLLKPDGILVIQTPEYPEQPYEALERESGRFLEMLKPDEHLFLFSRASLATLFGRIGFAHHTFEPAVFGHYDMFAVASRGPMSTHSAEDVVRALATSPKSRLVQAYLDLAEERDRMAQRHAALVPLEADVEHLKNQVLTSEDDRARRLEVIERQGLELERLDNARMAAERRNAELESALERVGATTGQAEELLRRARQGLVLRLAHALQPAGVARGIERAADLLHGAALPPRVVAGEPSRVAASEEPFVQASSAPADDSPVAGIRDPKTTEPFNYTPAVVEAILDDLDRRGFPVEEITVDPAEYHAYFAAAGYAERYPDYYSFNLPEKSLEHFVAATLLELGPTDVYIDIASEHSPVPEIYTRLFGCTSYRQDLAYPEGLHGDRIGGDAASMPVPDGFATRMALHCSFEHFEGDADMRFVREVARVLRPGGRVCFAPLYLSDRYGVLTDPSVAVAEQVSFDPDALVYCKPGWGNRHGRLYDAAHLESRIRRNLAGMQLKLYRVVNATDVDPSCYLQFAAVISRP
jgi:SAM-dependent methyltransferase